ncbi:hypothetical protein O6H91_13G037600 [Diphasiastrum complanatum]|uniref:Uncharacterized protein n=2 Tax=Diphasiastrum complanatum TaxID=34168 RepID=A0ACC2BTZ0_DIPCM|nr:hypothetical protein O6H91_13G037600 [Diphasiastrum complanatum]KAJ7533206.1 hypothetical protein O6H91_13G037600 [Diphasiastrum complanatum]
MDDQPESVRDSGGVHGKQRDFKGRSMKKKTMHPRNKYAENPPDFNILANLYPSFKQYVSWTSYGSARIDWTDYCATRELTKVLLEHDYGIKWWIPDGQLCPTVPNRVNYIHWIEDLLSLSPSPRYEQRQTIVGLDIGTGANCIYPLLGASLNGWSFVGTDITPVALGWALKNVQANPSIAELITVRKSSWDDFEVAREGTCTSKALIGDTKGTPFEMDRDLNPSTAHASSVSNPVIVDEDPPEKLKHIGLAFEGNLRTAEGIATSCHSLEVPLKSPAILVGVVKEGEMFDFCMCNPPFFETMEEAGANPRTACGGTKEEMVCPGGEVGFITRLIEDSLELKNKIHWYTTMVGQKVVMKAMVAKLRALGIAILRTTEFVQGRTSRWGLAWSFDAPVKTATYLNPSPGSNNISFLLEGLRGKCIPTEVLKALALHLEATGSTCKIDMVSYTISGSLLCSPKDLQLPPLKRSRAISSSTEKNYFGNNNFESLGEDSCTMSFKVVVFQQAPGAVLIKASLSKAENYAGKNFTNQDVSSVFTMLLGHVEREMKEQFASNMKPGI